MKKRWLFITLIIMFFIFFFSSQNGQQSSHTSGLFTTLVLNIFPFLDKNTLSFLIRKAAHFAIFGFLGYSLYKIEERTLYKPLIISFFYACSDEIHQLFVNNRAGQFRDVLIDTCGALIFIIIAKKKSSKKNSS
ncbi:MAG: VanZ family protein [Bacillota bacterium]|nr:VanZ family protein [Bacillota bacterium]